MSDFKVQFDNHGSSDPGSIEVTLNEKSDMEMWITLDGERKLVLSTWRDMWGVFIDMNRFYISIAQEDKTRSFLDAMSQAFQYLRTQCEAGTLPGEVNGEIHKNI